MAANQQYLEAFPALPPLASGLAADTAAAAVNQGAPLDVTNVKAAAMEYSVRKSLHRNGHATADEVDDAKRRKLNLETAHNFAGAAPAWALGLDQSLQHLTQQMTQQTQQMMLLQQQMMLLQQQMTQQMTQLPQQMSWLYDYYDARNFNRQSVRFENPTIHRVPKKTTGDLPPNASWFPATRGDLERATAMQIDPLLQFYGIAGGTLPARRVSLKNYLGVLNN
jgi:hypothetical protein